MLPITGYAPLNGWKQTGAPHWSTLEAHTFEASPKGELLHYTNGVLRASIPAEGFEGYLEAWPEAQPIVAAITGKKPASPEASSAAGYERTER
jgi:hypothetical protein